jgi:hypothetical protein
MQSTYWYMIETHSQVYRVVHTYFYDKKFEYLLPSSTYRADFFIGDRGVFKVFIHKKSVKNYRCELLFLTWIRKFNLQWNRMYDILKAYLIRFWLLMWPFGRGKCSLSIYAKPSSLACSVQKIYAFSWEPWNRPNDPKYGSG